MSNLLEKASILLTPTGYDNGSMNCIKPNTSVGDFDFTRATIASLYNSNGLIEFVGNNTPRISYLGDTCGYWLLEPQATNTATYSNDFTQGDIFNGSSNPVLAACILTTAASETSPDGFPFGDGLNPLLKDDGQGGFGQSKLQYFSTSVFSNNINVFSIFVKKSLSNDFIYMQTINFDSSASGTSWFNIQNGTLGTISSSHTAKIEDYGNGWFRCSIAFKTTTDLVGAVNIGLSIADNATNITRDGTNGVLLFGLQAEADASRNFATSYIPTSGSTVTRNKDEANNSGDSSLISSTEGVLYAEIAALANDSIARHISINSNNNNNSVDILYSTGSNKLQFRVTSNNSSDFLQATTLTDRTQFVKAAIKYKSGDIKCFVNGSEVFSDTSSFTFTESLQLLNLRRGGAGGEFEGKVKCVAVFKEALDNDELECLTGSGFDSFTALAEAGGYTII